MWAGTAGLFQYQVNDGWEHVLLDLDPKGNPDIVCDARELLRLVDSKYDTLSKV
jgi:hypothetical protein